LDESIRLWRMHWISYALVSAIALLPPGVLLVWLGSQQSARTRQIVDDAFTFGDGAFRPEDLLAIQAPGFAVYIILSALFGFLWSGAVVSTTDTYQRGREPGIGAVYGTALRRLGVMVVSALVFLLACIGLLIPSALLAVPTLGGLLGGPVAIICLLVWWMAPNMRKTWFKWLIILAAPFGLLVYILGRWWMFIAAIVLERQGPIDGLRRSWQLTAGHWFRVVGILLVVSLIVGILGSVVTSVIQVPLTISAASRGEIGMSPVETALVYGVSVVFQVLFTGMSGAVYGVLFNDLRNRREGADIAERLRELETSPQPASA
ncbi:MAG TPA: hypothetical protein VFG86_21500, partial [Chloroflexota bacterium]|nr:hypothetical protein [Chloroflexota bacterium]